MNGLSGTEDMKEEYYTHPRSDMLGYIPEDVGRVLEVGCGSGSFGSIIKERSGAEVWGIELSEEAAEAAGRVLDRVFVGDIEKNDFPLPEGYFDCIVFNDVLEHLLDPWALLKKVRGRLADGGLVVASIPNIRYYRIVKNLLLEKKWEYRDAGVLDRTHLRFFTCRSMREMFTGCGFEVVTIEGLRGKSPPVVPQAAQPDLLEFAFRHEVCTVRLCRPQEGRLMPLPSRRGILPDARSSFQEGSTTDDYLLPRP